MRTKIAICPLLYSQWGSDFFSASRSAIPSRVPRRIKWAQQRILQSPFTIRPDFPIKADIYIAAIRVHVYGAGGALNDEVAPMQWYFFWCHHVCHSNSVDLAEK